MRGGNKMESLPFFKGCATSVQKVQPTDATSTQYHDQLEMTTLMQIISTWVPEEVSVYGARVQELTSSEVCKSRPDFRFFTAMLLQFYPAFMRDMYDLSNVKVFGQIGIQCHRNAHRDAASFKQGSYDWTTLICLPISLMCYRHTCQLASQPEWDWDECCGPNGNLLTLASQHYRFATMHQKMIDFNSFDGIISVPSTSLPLLWHYGDVAGARANLDRSLDSLQTFLSNPSAVGTLTFVFASCCMPWALHVVGRDEDAAALMRQMKVDWHHAEATVQCIERLVPTMGDRESDPMFKTEDLLWHLRSLYALVARDASVYSQFRELLPSAAAYAELGVISVPAALHANHGAGFTHLTAPMLVTERLGMREEAMAFATLGTSFDQTKGGSAHFVHHAHAHRCRGRLLAAQGHLTAAAAAFEASVQAAARCGYHLLEAVAVRELITHVLRPSGRVVEGSKRLDQVMQKLATSKTEMESVYMVYQD